MVARCIVWVDIQVMYLLLGACGSGWEILELFWWVLERYLIIKCPIQQMGWIFSKRTKIRSLTLSQCISKVNNSVDPHYFEIFNLEIKNIENIRVFIDGLSIYLLKSNQLSLMMKWFCRIKLYRLKFLIIRRFCQSREFSISIDGLDAGSFSNWFCLMIERNLYTRITTMLLSMILLFLHQYSKGPKLKHSKSL